METVHSKFDSQMQVDPDVHRKAVLLAILCNVFLALLLLPAYICIAVFLG